MRQSILPVAKGFVTIAVATLLFYAISQIGRAQQGEQPSVVPFEAPVDVDTAGLRGPTQPIFYRHDVHAGQYQMDCKYCHFAAEVSSSPGMPTLSTCMGCHLIAGSGNPEVQKLRDSWNANEVVEWVEIHQLPPFVHFPHMVHVNPEAGLECQDCHGPIETMPQVYQFASLKMGWCLDCHTENEATTDCTACHY